MEGGCNVGVTEADGEAVLDPSAGGRVEMSVGKARLWLGWGAVNEV